MWKEPACTSSKITVICDYLSFATVTWLFFFFFCFESEASACSRKQVGIQINVLDVKSFVLNLSEDRHQIMYSYN